MTYENSATRPAVAVGLALWRLTSAGQFFSLAGTLIPLVIGYMLITYGLEVGQRADAAVER